MERETNSYEIIGDNLKIRWHEGFNDSKVTHTQVSGYIFNTNNQLLIVKNNSSWTIPGGHPEGNESYLETLNREIMEEACITIKDAVLMGAVEVFDNGKTYYQYRYTARVDKILPFIQEWETCERMFVNLNELENFIPWANGRVFGEQLKSATNYWELSDAKRT